MANENNLHDSSSSSGKKEIFINAVVEWIKLGKQVDFNTMDKHSLGHELCRMLQFDTGEESFEGKFLKYYQKHGREISERLANDKMFRCKVILSRMTEMPNQNATDQIEMARKENLQGKRQVAKHCTIIRRPTIVKTITTKFKTRTKGNIITRTSMKTIKITKYL